MSSLLEEYDGADVCALGTGVIYPAVLVAIERPDGLIAVFADDNNADGISTCNLTKPEAARFARRLLAISEPPDL